VVSDGDELLGEAGASTNDPGLALVLRGGAGREEGDGGDVDVHGGTPGADGDGADVNLRPSAMGAGGTSDGVVAVIPAWGGDTTPFLTLVGNGANSATVRLFAGDRDPTGNVTGNPGDYYLRADGTDSELMIHQAASSSDTGWTGVLAQTWADVLAEGNASGGTDVVVSDGDLLDVGTSGIDSAGPIAIQASGTSAQLGLTTTEGGGLTLRAQSTDANPDWRLNVNSGESFFYAVGGTEMVRFGSTGNITMQQAGNPTLSINTTTVGNQAIIELEENGNVIWDIRKLAGAGGNFRIGRFNSSGSFQGTALAIANSDGDTTLEANLDLNSASPTGTFGNGAGSAVARLQSDDTGASTLNFRKETSDGPNDYQWVHDADEYLALQIYASGWTTATRWNPSGTGLGTGTIEHYQNLYMASASATLEMGTGVGSPHFRQDVDGSGTGVVRWVVDGGSPGAGAKQWIFDGALTNLTLQHHTGSAWEDEVVFNGSTIEVSAHIDPSADDTYDCGDSAAFWRRTYSEGLVLGMEFITSATTNNTHFYWVDNTITDRTITFNEGEPIGTRYEILVVDNGNHVTFAREGSETINGDTSIEVRDPVVQGLYIAIKDGATTWRLYGPIAQAVDTPF
jgi:hypothetical protein